MLLFVLVLLLVLGCHLIIPQSRNAGRLRLIFNSPFLCPARIKKYRLAALPADRLNTQHPHQKSLPSFHNLVFEPASARSIAPIT